MLRSRRRKSRVSNTLRFEALEQRQLLAAEGLVSHWPLDRANTHFLDEGPAGIDLVSIGSQRHEDSDRGRALLMTGIIPGPHLLDPDVNLDLDDGVTISAWFKTTNIDQGGFVFSVSPTGLQLHPIGDKLRFSVQTTKGNGLIVTHLAEGTFDFKNDRWYHIAGTYNGERLVAYVNGDDVGSTEASGDIKIDGDLSIGTGWLDNEPIKEFRGAIDEVQLYDRALTPGQIGDLVAQPSALETSDEPSFLNADNDPVFIDPHMEIRSQRDNFRGGMLAALMNPLDFHAGDSASIANTDSIEVDGDEVFYKRDGISNKIGMLGFSSNPNVIVRHLTEAATPAAVEALGRAMTFTTTADDPETNDRRFRIDLSTHNIVPPFSDERVVRFGVPSNVPLALETSTGASEFDPDGDPIFVDPQVEVVANSANLDGGKLTVRFAENSGRDSDRLLIRNTLTIVRTGELVRLIRPGSPSVVIGSVSGGNGGAPLVVELNENATPDAVKALARAVSYNNIAAETPDHPRFVRFVLEDGQGAEVADIKKIEIANVPPPVNLPPNIEIPEGATVFQEGSEPVAVLPTVGITDVDSPNFAGGSLRVTFAEGTGKEGDRLSVKSSDRILVDGGNVFDKNADPPERIGEVEVLENGRVLVLYFNEHVNHDLAELIARTVHFGNAAVDPLPGVRLIRFELNDGDGGSDADIRRVEVATTNDPPVVEFAEGATLFEEDHEVVLVDPNVEVGDPDSPNFGGGKLIADFAEQTRREGDRLGIRGSEQLLIQGNDLRLVVEGQSIKIADFTFNEDVLVIEFNEDADAAAVQKVARQITFGNESQAVSNDDRLVRFTVSDGDGGSAADIRRIEVENANDPPLVEFAEGATEYSDATVRVDARVEVADPDSANFDSGQLTVFFVEQSKQEGDFVGLVPSESLLIQGNDLQIVRDGEPIKVADFRFDSAALVITFNSEADAGVVQRVARHVVFGNEGDAVPEGDRFVKFVVTDGDGGEHGDVKRIVVQRANLDPVVAVAEGATIFEVSEDPVVVAPRIEIGDADSGNFAGGRLIAETIEQTGVTGDWFGVREGEGITVDGDKVFLNREAERVLLATIVTRESLIEEFVLILELTEHATPATTQRLARQITFGSDVEEIGDNAERLVRMTVLDGDGGTGADVKRIELILRPDDDLDGVDDDVEDEAPFEGDGNRDGVRDSEQDHVASVRGAGDRFVTISSSEATRLLNVQPMDDPSPDDHPLDTQFPVGFFDFQVDGVHSSTTTVVTVHLEAGADANSYYVFGPTPEDPNPHWYPFLFDGETGAKIFGDRIEIHFIDGQRGDSDLSENGIISDPGAPALTRYPWQNPGRLGDVNYDGIVTALDALLIMNDLRINQSRDLPLLASGTEQLGPMFWDVSGDNYASSLDALRVINLLAQNTRNAAQESELVSAGQVGSPMIAVSSNDDDDDDDQRLWDEAILGIAESLS